MESSMPNKKYQTYKRGSVVLIDFGKGVDKELNSKHLGVVLTKNDSPNNGVLTVIPLSSKEKPYYLSLGKIVSNVIMPMVLTEKEEIDKEFKLIKNRTKIVGDTIEFLEDLDSLDNDFAKEIMEEASKDTKTLDRDMKQFKRNIDDLQKVFNTYGKMDKGSYAMVMNISTVSKLKVMKPLNKFDPIRKIKLPDKLMDEIDNKIIELFTK